MKRRSTVTRLRVVKPGKRKDRPPQELLAQLAMILREAEAGRVHSIAFVAAVTDHDGDPNFFVTKYLANANDAGNVLGRLEILKTDIAGWWLDEARAGTAAPEPEGDRA